MKKNKFAAYSFLALIPVISFLAQYYFSMQNGTLDLMLHHYNVSIVDFIFIPFNLLVYKSINWEKGTRVFILFLIALILSSIVHYGWAINQTDPGHMVKADGFITKSGWTHIIFSAVEFFLMLSFVFNYLHYSYINLLANTILIEMYLVFSLAGGYFIHYELLTEDIVRVSVGFILFALYYLYRLRQIKKRSEDESD